MNNFKKLFIGIILLLCMMIPIKVNAEESTIYKEFIKNIGNSTNSHYVLKGQTYEYFIANEDMIVYVVLGEKENKLNINVLFVKKNDDAFLRIRNSIDYKNYYSDSYGIIYGIDYPFNSEIIFEICIDGVTPVFDSMTLPVFESIAEYKTLEITTTNGTANFPENYLLGSSLSLEDSLIYITISGIVICIILGIVLILLVKTKKVNVRRENIFGIVDQEDSKEDYIDVNYSVPTDEIKQEETKRSYVYTKENLTELYRKRFNNEISEAEFDYALKKYLSAREDDDLDD